MLTPKVNMRARIYFGIGFLCICVLFYTAFYFNVSGLEAYQTVISISSSALATFDSPISDTRGYLNSPIHHNCEDDSSHSRDSEQDLWRIFRNVSAGFGTPLGALSDTSKIKDTIAHFVSQNSKLHNYGWNRKHCGFLHEGRAFTTRPMRVKLYAKGFSILSLPPWMRPGGWECKNRRSHCIFYSQNNNLTFPEYDVVLVHMRGFYSVNKFMADYPNNRRNSQPWILVNTESQVHSFSNPKGLSHLSQYFNYTAMMGTKSDISFSYAECRHIASIAREWPTTQFSREAMPEAMKFWVDFPNFAASKDKLVLWVVSNCNARSKRHIYVKELSKHIPVDILGPCGHVKNNPLTQCTSKYVCPEVFNKYKFYLSFENSFCQDYVTEKTFKIMVPGMYTVPVVMGLADYDTIVPKNSYIDVRNFTSAEHLASYLKYLDKNDDAYNSYFDWRKQYVCRNRIAADPCELCEALQGLPFNSPHPEPNLTDVYGSQNCVSPEKFF